MHTHIDTERQLVTSHRHGLRWRIAPIGSYALAASLTYTEHRDGTVLIEQLRAHPAAGPGAAVALVAALNKLHPCLLAWQLSDQVRANLPGAVAAYARQVAIVNLIEPVRPR